MNAIKMMMEEHIYIKRMLKVVRKMAELVMADQEPNREDFGKAIEFIRQYADVHHHMKEEKVLFKYMKDELAEMMGGSIDGMLIEHNFGRMYIANIEEALRNYATDRTESRLEIIANAIGYTNLLDKHIDKEDKGIYLFGEKNLSPDVLAKVEAESLALEQEATQAGTQTKYLEILFTLEEKYLAS